MAQKGRAALSHRPFDCLRGLNVLNVRIKVASYGLQKTESAAAESTLYDCRGEMNGLGEFGGGWILAWGKRWLLEERMMGIEVE